MKTIINKLLQRHISLEDLDFLLHHAKADDTEFLFAAARQTRETYYKKEVYLRGLIEFTNYCRNDCLYCGIRCSNNHLERYRLSPENILSCCENGYRLGFRTFVLQGGEDIYFTRDYLADIISQIHTAYPDCAITLSFGEWRYDDYKCWFDAGAERYLLRHETASDEHYKKLHPSHMQLSNRKKCLNELKSIGYQTGAGFMVGSPFQTTEHIYNDLIYLLELQPAMIGIGPFIHHKDTPFAAYENGSVEMTLRLLAILRLLLPEVLLPATTALATLDINGQQKGLLAGANVIMPNLSPLNIRDKYSLYDNKSHTGNEAAETLSLIKANITSIGCQAVISRGDSKLFHS